MKNEEEEGGGRQCNRKIITFGYVTPLFAWFTPISKITMANWSVFEIKIKIEC